MRFVAGSHNRGHLTSRISDTEENNLFTQTVSDAERYGRFVNVELKAGEISMHADLLLHSSGQHFRPRSSREGIRLRPGRAFLIQPLPYRAATKRNACLRS